MSIDETTVSNPMGMMTSEQPHCSSFTVFPGNDPKSGKRRIPAVATSESWEKYYREQDAIKRNAEFAKRRRLEERQKRLNRRRKKRL